MEKNSTEIAKNIESAARLPTYAHSSGAVGFDSARRPQSDWIRRSLACRVLCIVTLACVWLWFHCKDVTLSLNSPSEDTEPDLSPFSWRPCPNSKDRRWKCGHIILPLDWHNASDHRTVQIETVLFQPNTLKKSQRTMVINPGGPGGSGVSYAWGRAEQLSRDYTNSTFDVLGFDPRGVNASEPHISCYPRDAYRDRWATLSVPAFKEPGDKRYELETMDSLNEALMKGCEERYGDIPRFITTASVARDMDAIREALNEQELTYYGVSYGTGLGQTYAQMFAKRVGRMLIDALEYVPQGRTTTGFGTAALVDIVRAWREGFLGECVKAGSKRCALVESGQDREITLADLEKRTNALFARLLDRPQSAFHPEVGPGLVTYQDVIDLIYSSLYRPVTSWSRLAQQLSELEKGNGTAILKAIEDSLFSYDPELLPPIPKRKTQGDAGILVICGDSYDAPHPGLDFYEKTWAQMANKSFVGGDSRFSDIFPCRHFRWTPNEVYRGNLSHSLANPMLLIAETFDPATPLVNGKQLFADMGRENARLIVHHGYGHSSTNGGYSRNCTERIKREYFLSGQLPAEDVTECYVDEGGPFLD